MRRVTRIVTAPATMPVTLDEVKAHGNISFSDDDTILAIYLSTAVAIAEKYLQRKIVTQTWKMWLDYWPPVIKVMFGDLQSVTSIKYTDINDVQVTVDSDTYDVDINSVPGRIRLKYGQSWPSAVLNATNPIEIQFVTGYTTVPPDIKNAILLTTQHFYENRENYLISEIGNAAITEIPMTANALLADHRVWDWII
jgi:uncharacterized phiE125 gp8 family phage protein